MSRHEPVDTRPRSRAQGAADRGGRDPRPGRSPRRATSSARSQLLFECRGRVIVTGMGKSGIICRKIAATLSSTGTSAWFLHPAEAIHGDLGAIREDDVVLALSHSGETEELVRLLESIRRIGARLIALTGDPRSTLAQGRRRDARLRHRRGGLPDEPGADGEHDRGTGAGRRAGDDAARAQGLPRGGVRLAPSRRQARPAADAGRERRCTPATPPRSSRRSTPMPDVIHEMSSKRLGMTCVVDDGGVSWASSPTATCGG